MIAVPTESPTRIASTPDSSTSRPKSASYAVITTSFSPLRFFSANSRTVTGFVSDLFLSNARAPQCCQLPQPETAVRELGMGNGQARFTHALPLEHHDVEIQCPGAPARCPHSACLLFDALERGDAHLLHHRNLEGARGDSLTDLLEEIRVALCHRLGNEIIDAPIVDDVLRRRSRSAASHP